jgi:hypothetical protein
MINFKVYDPIQQLIAAGGGFDGGDITNDISMIQPAKVIQCENALNDCDVTNLRSVKAYVDSKISNTSNPKQLKGSGTANNAVIDLNIGTGLDIDTSNTLVVNKATDSTFGVIQLNSDLGFGDLTRGSTDGIAVIASNKVTYDKIQKVAGAKKLLGSETPAANVTEIGIGQGLDIISPGNLILDNTTNPLTAGDTRFGLIKFDTAAGDLSQTSLNSGIAKLKPTASTKQLKGSNTNDTIVRDLTLSDNFKVDNTLNLIDLTYEYQKKLVPTAEDEVAIFNNQGFLTNSTYKFDTSNNPPNYITLWSSWRTWVSFQFGCTIFVQNGNVDINGTISGYIPFSNNNILGDPFQYEDVSTAGTSVKVDSTDATVVIIENLFRFPVFYKITFLANKITVSDDPDLGLSFYFTDINGTEIGVKKTLYKRGEVTLPYAIKINAATDLITPGIFKFKVLGLNLNVNTVTLSGIIGDNPSLLLVERTA